MKNILTNVIVWLINIVISAIGVLLFTIVFEKLYEKVQVILEKRRNRKEAKCQ